MNNKYANDFSESTRNYINSISSVEYEPIPKEIEDELVRRVKKGDKHAHKQLVNAHLRLVVSIAKRYKGINVEMADLISEGNLGLLTAIERFDPEKGARLCHYATWWITKMILESISNKSKQTENEVEFTGLTTDNNENNTEPSAKAEKETYITEETNNEEYYQEVVESLLSQLDDRSRHIVECYYGLNNKKQLTVNELSKELSISMERVRQIRNRAMMTLRSFALINNVSTIER